MKASQIRKMAANSRDITRVVALSPGTNTRPRAARQLGRVSAALVVDSDVLWFPPKAFSRAVSRLVLTLTLPSDVVWFKIDNRRLTAVDCGSRYGRWEIDIFYFYSVLK